MKRLFLIFILSSFFSSLKSQTKALTESGREVVLYENGTDIKFVFMGYYYTNDNGTLQLVGYTSEKLFLHDKKEMEELLNGLTVINN